MASRSVTIAMVASASLEDYEAQFQKMKQSVVDLLIDEAVLQQPLP